VGVARVMSLLDVPRSTYYARKAAEEARQDTTNAKPRGRPPLVSDDALLAAIRRVIAESPFVGEGHKKIHVRLRLAGVRATVTRVLRLMRENDLLAPTRLGNAHGPKAHDGSITPSRPDEIWGTDMTQTLLESGMNAAIFAVVDHATSECLGLFAAERGRRFEAVEALRQAVHHRGLKADKDALVGIKLRHDHGSQFIAKYFQDEVAFLGLSSSPAFVREPQGNGTAERFFRTLKENLLWLRRFSDVASLQAALDEFRSSYNTRWLIGRHGYVSPSEQHRRLLAKVSQAA
jgi:transposase InsO family protein